MPTQCNADTLLFAPVERRSVVASFNGGAITSDAGALLLGATDRAIGLVGVTWEFLQDCTLSEAEAGWVEAAGAQRPEPFARPLDLRPEVVASERDVLPLHGIWVAAER